MATQFWSRGSSQRQSVCLGLTGFNWIKMRLRSSTRNARQKSSLSISDESIEELFEKFDELTESDDLDLPSMNSSYNEDMEDYTMNSINWSDLDQVKSPPCPEILCTPIINQISENSLMHCQDAATSPLGEQICSDIAGDKEFINNLHKFFDQQHKHIDFYTHKR